MDHRLLSWLRRLPKKKVGLGHSVHEKQVHGTVIYWLVDENGLWTPKAIKDNLILLTWGSCIAHTLKGDTGYVPDAAYFEYANLASPSDTVTAPSFVRSDNRGYYDGLASDRDFIRVALTSTPTLSIATGYESFFSSGDGNKLTFTAQTSGTVGENGKAFSNASNSKVYGAALVARPVPADRTRDVLFARSYLDAGDQLLKPASGQISLTWSISFI